MFTLGNRCLVRVLHFHIIFKYSRLPSSRIHRLCCQTAFLLQFSSDKRHFSAGGRNWLKSDPRLRAGGKGREVGRIHFWPLSKRSVKNIHYCKMYIMNHGNRDQVLNGIRNQAALCELFLENGNSGFAGCSERTAVSYKAGEWRSTFHWKRTDQNRNPFTVTRDNRNGRETAFYLLHCNLLRKIEN